MVLLDTLKELSIVSREFPLPMDRAMRETKLNRVKEAERDESEMDELERLKLVDNEERIGSLRTELNFKKMEEEDYEEEKKCKALRKRWLRDCADIFKETLTREDRLKVPPIKIELVEGWEKMETFKPKTPIEVSPYLEPAAKRELSRMVEAGMLEEIDCWTEHLSRVFFVEKPGREEVQAWLVADFRSVNRRIRRLELPLEGSWNILRRLNPHDSYFGCVDFSSGFSQFTLDESSRDLFCIILP